MFAISDQQISNYHLLTNHFSGKQHSSVHGECKGLNFIITSEDFVCYQWASIITMQIPKSYCFIKNYYISEQNSLCLYVLFIYIYFLLLEQSKNGGINTAVAVLLLFFIMCLTSSAFCNIVVLSSFVNSPTVLLGNFFMSTCLVISLPT